MLPIDGDVLRSKSSCATGALAAPFAASLATVCADSLTELSMKGANHPQHFPIRWPCELRILRCSNAVSLPQAPPLPCTLTELDTRVCIYSGVFSVTLPPSITSLNWCDFVKPFDAAWIFSAGLTSLDLRLPAWNPPAGSSIALRLPPMLKTLDIRAHQKTQELLLHDSLNFTFLRISNMRGRQGQLAITIEDAGTDLAKRRARSGAGVRQRHWQRCMRSANRSATCVFRLHCVHFPLAHSINPSPASLVLLTLGNSFTGSLSVEAWNPPPLLHSLALSSDWNRPLEELRLHPSLTCLAGGLRFAQPLAPLCSTLPVGLLELNLRAARLEKQSACFENLP